MLLPRLGDARPLVRSITCWALSRYSRWLAQRAGQPGASSQQADAVLQVRPMIAAWCIALAGHYTPCRQPGRAPSVIWGVRRLWWHALGRGALAAVAGGLHVLEDGKHEGLWWGQLSLRHVVAMGAAQHETCERTSRVEDAKPLACRAPGQLEHLRSP